MPQQPIDAKAIWEDVKANRARLDACPRHAFAPLPVKIGQPVTCTVCSGTLGLVDVSYYIRGFVAAGGDPNVVWPNWKKDHTTHG